jgi:hypothetical protein
MPAHSRGRALRLDVQTSTLETSRRSLPSKAKVRSHKLCIADQRICRMTRTEITE